MSEKPTYEELEQRVRELEQAESERKLAEKALRESEERYRSFVQNFQGIAFRGKINFTPIFFHGAVEEITGYTEDEFVAGKPRWDQVIHPDDLALLLQSKRRNCIQSRAIPTNGIIALYAMTDRYDGYMRSFRIFVMTQAGRLCSKVRSTTSPTANGRRRRCGRARSGTGHCSTAQRIWFTYMILKAVFWMQMRRP